MEKCNYRKDPHQDIDHVFRDLLPAHGMVERPAQVELSHQMLDTMLNGSIALCDAGTGIGKTYAYLVAGVVFRRYRSRAGLPNQPLLISTSSIVLQGAIIHDYLPFLSKVMMADGMLDSPLRAVLRKGKSHYVCDARLMKRLQTANLDRKNPLAKAALLSMRDHLDLDMAPHLSGYDRERICVPPTCDCGKTECRYLCYLDVCVSERYAIQVCNHNLLLADAIHRGSGKRSILPDSCAIVMDEAHKLTEIARQMFGITLEAGELHTLCRKLRREQFLLAAETLEDTAGLLLSEMAKPWSGDSSFSHFSIPLDGVERTLSVIHRQIRRMLTAGTRMELERVLDKTKLFCLHQPDMVYYTAEDETGGSMLCASATDLTAQLRQTLTTTNEANQEVETEETYTVAIPITDMEEVWANIQTAMEIIVSQEQRNNADSIYNLVKYGTSTGTEGWIPGAEVPFVGTDGFCSPVGSGWESRVTSEFGYRSDPFTGQTKGHTGIDIAVPTGTPVCAALPGVVTTAAYNAGGYGYYVMVDHGNGMVTLYAHNSRLLVRVGETVEAGDVVSLSGSTGRSTGPHLHFEVRVNGQRVNPRSYLPTN